MILLNVSHRNQRQPADCLASCAAMVLDYLKLNVDYDELLSQFETRYFGAPFSNIHKLESIGLSVATGEWGGLEIINSCLNLGLPVLVNVQTGELKSYWKREASHVVLVVGLDETEIIIHDPAFDDPAKRIAVDEFMLAWDEQYQRYGIIALDDIELNGN